MIRRLPLGGKAKLKIVRGGKPTEIVMSLESPPISDENVKRMTDTDLEFSARELSYTDRVNQQIPEGLQGVLLQKVETGGLASLGGLRGNDFVMSVDGKPTSTVAELKAGSSRSARTSRGGSCSSCGEAFTPCIARSSPTTDRPGNRSARPCATGHSREPTAPGGSRDSRPPGAVGSRLLSAKLTI